MRTVTIRGGRAAALLTGFAVAAALGNSTLVRGQEDPGVPPALVFDNTLVFDESQDRIIRYYLVRFGQRRVADPEQIDPKLDVHGLSADVLSAIPEGPPLQAGAPSLPGPAETNTPTPVPTKTPEPFTPTPTRTPTMTPTPTATP